MRGFGDARSFPTATLCPTTHGSQHRVQLPDESLAVQSATSTKACSTLFLLARASDRGKTAILFSTRSPLTEVMTKGGPPGVSLIPRAYKSPTSVTVIALSRPAAPLRPPQISSAMNQMPFKNFEWARSSTPPPLALTGSAKIFEREGAEMLQH
jgi:hypothetical protein